MKVPSFNEFLSESSHEKYKIVVLTRKPENDENTKVFKTSQRIEEEAKKLGLECYVCFIDGAYLTFENNVRTIHNSDDDKGFPISSEDTIFIVRGGVNKKDVWKDLLTQVERAGITCVNTRACMELCADKYMTSLRLADAGLVSPTTVLIPDVDSAKVSFEKLDTDYLQSTFLSKANVVGADFEYALPDPAWIVSGYTATSTLLGNEEIISEIQRNSAHYFQRPDDDIKLDTTKIQLDGTSSEISLTKISGKNIKGSLTYRQISPGYDINELGYLRSANTKQLKSYIEYEDFVPKKYWQLFSFSFGTWNDKDYQWKNGSHGLWTDLWIRLNNWYSVSLDFERSEGGINRTLTRGGPLAGLPAYNKFGFRLRTDRRKSLNGYFGMGYRKATDGEYDKSFRTGINYRPNEQWKIELDVFTNKEFDTDQFIISIDDELATNTFYKRYIFSDITNDSKGFSFETNMIASPQLSFQFFLRPEISQYEYQDLKEFLEPKKYNFNYFDEDQIVEIDDETIEIDPDRDGAASSFQLSSDYIKGFNFLSLRSNFIIKWEYKPGSALFLVWQQQRDHYEVTESQLKLSSGLDKLMRSNKINTILLKVAYWFSS